MYCFWSSLFPVTLIRSAFTTTTKSPVSTCGVYSALPLPRSVSAICVARRPRVFPSASTTNQRRSTSCGFAVQVFMAEKAAELRPPRRDCSNGLVAAKEASQGKQHQYRRADREGRDSQSVEGKAAEERETRSGQRGNLVVEAEQLPALGRQGPVGELSRRRDEGETPAEAEEKEERPCVQHACEP